ncbi:MAG TPA: hypothetical protein VEU77_06675 [Candidatus Acidoferrales bacterium]|nr:hypothetical protein [Candidatus Acidoferrales bacterium]
MKRTRLSLYYLAAYLLFAGVALVLAPKLALQLLLAKGDYGEVLPRLLGVVLFALGVFVAQVVRYGITQLYTTTLAVRVVILLVLVWLYVSTADPLFLVLLGIVGLGFVLTGTSYLLDRRASS